MADGGETVSNTRGLPKEIQALYDRAVKAGDLAGRFLAFTDLILTATDIVTRIKRITREHEKELKKVEAEIQFLSRHKAKEDMAFRAMRGSYASPEKAFGVFNELCQSYAPDYVVEVIKLGSYRLGSATGMSFLGMRMAGREEADANYEKAVVPALATIAADQREYLKLKDTDLEVEHEKVLKFVSTIADQRLALEAAIREYTRERLEVAISMQPSDLENLNADELKYRQTILPEKLQDARPEP